MKKFAINGIRIHSWCAEIDDGAMKQIEAMTRLPFLFEPIAVMADCHQGFGMPIGGVLATKDVVIPNAVGVDIGCGMQAVATNIHVDTIHRSQLETLVWGIRGTVPLGFDKREQPAAKNALPYLDNFALPTDGSSVVRKHFSAARKQMGTLGGGNHFIEVQADEDGMIWLMLHSGSRNIGLQVAKHYHQKAVEACMRDQSLFVKDLAHLPTNSALGRAYLAEMQWCVAFARENRRQMMDEVMGLFDELMRCDFEKRIDVAHNFAALERHFDEEVWVHRKGATRARVGEWGIIPGSQGTHSYLVRGKGAVESFKSCSHGAGRVMSRREAVRTLNLKKVQRAMDEKGILHRLHTKKDLDEASDAYKDIDVVMEAQRDLVDVMVKLRPLAVVKG